MNTVILSCTTLLEYVQQAQNTCNTNFPVIELNRQYHVEPSKMKEHILQTLAGLSKDIDTVLVAMGFCGGSWQNVSSSKRLVIPRVADCVALELTTPEHYTPDLKETGHMYLFGDAKNGFSIRAIYENLLEQYDKEMADIIFDRYFEYYYHLDIIDNGLYDCYNLDYVKRAQADADRIHAELDFVPGSNILLEKLVSSQWDEQFFVVEPNHTITQENFFTI